MAGIGFPGQYYDSENELRISEVTWPSSVVIGEKLDKLVDTWHANRTDLQDARKRRSSLTAPPGKYQQRPRHLEMSTEELREAVAKADADVAAISARPAVDEDIKKLVAADLEKMQERAAEQNREATDAYVAAIDALEKARKGLAEAREDMRRVKRLQGEQEIVARRLVLPTHVGTGTDVRATLQQMRAQVTPPKREGQ